MQTHVTCVLNSKMKRSMERIAHYRILTYAWLRAWDKIQHEYRWNWNRSQKLAIPKVNLITIYWIPHSTFIRLSIACTIEWLVSFNAIDNTRSVPPCVASRHYASRGGAWKLSHCRAAPTVTVWPHPVVHQRCDRGIDANIGAWSKRRYVEPMFGWPVAENSSYADVGSTYE